MELVSVRQLLRNPKKFLFPHKFRLTRYGQPLYDITIEPCQVKEDVRQTLKKNPLYSEGQTLLKNKSSYTHYPCGCERGVNSKCQIHK